MPSATAADAVTESVACTAQAGTSLATVDGLIAEQPLPTLKLCAAPAPNDDQPGVAHVGAVVVAASAQVAPTSEAATPTERMRRRPMSAAGLHHELAGAVRDRRSGERRRHAATRDEAAGADVERGDRVRALR